MPAAPTPFVLLFLLQSPAHTENSTDRRPLAKAAPACSPPPHNVDRRSNTAPANTAPGRNPAHRVPLTQTAQLRPENHSAGSKPVQYSAGCPPLAAPDAPPCAISRAPVAIASAASRSHPGWHTRPPLAD